MALMLALGISACGNNDGNVEEKNKPKLAKTQKTKKTKKTKTIRKIKMLKMMKFLP